MRPTPSPVASRLALLLALGLLSGCASVKVDQSYRPGTNFAAYQTFAIMPAAEQADRFGKQSLPPATAQRIEDALARELAARGLRPADRDRADLAIAYVAGRRTTTDGATYGRTFKYEGINAEPVPITKDVQEGSLMVDLVDARTGDLVWRGAAQGKPGGSAIERAVQAMLRQYPPSDG